MPDPFDVAIKIGEDGADLALESGDLAIDRGLSTGVLISLLSDARAPADAELPGAADDRRGWWGEDRGDRFGSLLWLLIRTLATAQTLERARLYAIEALAWLQREGIASRIEVAASYGPRHELSLEVKIYRGTSSQWARLWEETERTDFKAQGLQLTLLPA